MTAPARSPLRPAGRCANPECRRGGCAAALGLDSAARDRLMPMHMVVGMDGTILHAGPTLAKLRPENELLGSPVLSHFDLRRPRGGASISDLVARPETAVRLALRDGHRTGLKGQVAPLSCGRAVLIDLSFGISVVEAVRRYRLTLSDFGGTDLAVEMLFVVEAQSAAMTESKKFSIRLQTAREAAEEEASTDQLTGAGNRRALDQTIARHAEAGQPFALVHLDLDGFKSVNDVHGHLVGDRVLKITACRIAETVRASDTVVRMGGDEFAVVLDGTSDPRDLSDICDRLVARIAEPLFSEGSAIGVTASVGAVVSTLYERPVLEAMLVDTDAALYASKRDGGAHYKIARPERRS